ncbi:MAG: metal ABC transporter substrate-binding protein [Acidobacteriota bacterium]|nr:metal ABC transporter substrate-binding protein [Acidobacteriota bacterium]
MGDVHPMGNPHYWLNPENGRRIAKALAAKFSEMRPGDAAYFTERDADFAKRLTDAEKRLDAALAPYRGRKVITYHRSWPNFCERFGLVVADYVEPKPGIPPTPAHTLEVINTMKRDQIKLILVEPYFDLRTQLHCAGHRGDRGCSDAFSGRYQRDHRLFQAVRLRHKCVDQGVYKDTLN